MHSIGSTHTHDMSIPTFDPFLLKNVRGLLSSSEKERSCFLFLVKCCQVRWWVGLLFSRPPHLPICRPDAEMRDGGPWIHPCPVARVICSCGQYKLAKHGWTWTASYLDDQDGNRRTTPVPSHVSPPFFGNISSANQPTYANLETINQDH